MSEPDYFYQPMYQPSRVVNLHRGVPNRTLSVLFNTNVSVFTDDKVLFSPIQGLANEKPAADQKTVVNPNFLKAARSRRPFKRTKLPVAQIAGSREVSTADKNVVFNTSKRKSHQSIKSGLIVDKSSNTPSVLRSTRLANVSALKEKIRRLSKAVKLAKKRVLIDEGNSKLKEQLAVLSPDEKYLVSRMTKEMSVDKKPKKMLRPPKTLQRKKLNLRKLKHEIPIADTEYVMEIHLDPEVIATTRKGNYESWKEPIFRVNYNRGADLRDEYSTYCGQRKTIKNWLFYV